MTPTLGQLTPDEVRSALRQQSGLLLHIGPYVARLRSPLHAVASAVGTLYAHHAVAGEQDFVDFDVSVRRPSGARALWHPQVVFETAGQEPFNPLPGDQGFPLLEWGLNWCVYSQCHQHLTLHAAVLERRGRALILPAPSGSGKSTLCAALAFSGWRLLSDELALVDPATLALLPIPRPVSLKNASIDVIRSFVPQVTFGSLVRETGKGIVAHFAPPQAAVQASTVAATPGWVVFPKYIAGANALLKPLERSRATVRLIENAFNYDIFAGQGFELLTSLIDRSRCFTFEYGDLAEAVTLFARLGSDEHV